MSEQPMPTAGSVYVTPAARRAFLEMLSQREAKGIATYGTTLQSHNGRDAVRDAMEELIDAWQYVVQVGLERDSLLAQMADLRAQLAATAAPSGEGAS